VRPVVLVGHDSLERDHALGDLHRDGQVVELLVVEQAPLDAPEQRGVGRLEADLRLRLAERLVPDPQLALRRLFCAASRFASTAAVAALSSFS
jgi:hypothetical protein